MKVISDTSGWYAFAVKPDLYYFRAKEFVESTAEFIIPFTVFEETVALLQRRQGKILSVEIGRALLGMGLTYLSEKEISKSWEMFEKSESGKISFVDCTVATLARKLELPIFTFDSHFKKMGLQVLP